MNSLISIHATHMQTYKGPVHFFPSLYYLQLLVDKQTGHAHTSANAHGGEQDLGLAASALTQTSDDLSCACAAERVALGSEGQWLF